MSTAAAATQPPTSLIDAAMLAVSSSALPSDKADKPTCAAPGPSPFITIMEPEDPQHPINATVEFGYELDHDAYEELLLDGLGDDNDEDKGDEEEDNEGNNGTDSSSGTRGTKPTCQPLPQWLSTAFEEKVKKCLNYGDNGLPPLYQDQKMFWFPWPSSFLLHTSDPSLTLLYNPQFFLWDPLSLCGKEGIPCPNCKMGLCCFRTIEWLHQCIDINRVFWMIGSHYHCNHCTNPNLNKKTITF
jgi:hypothetical protein